ncbi:helix-turn-helix domain-containing protein [Candidatus Enterovibrio escicola]|uniref:helix-turn-helix domain-containing protein n=1 Tax=Candidatus Enterovibrio escicola TaxID=1927127 RepID=UPI000BE47C91|nr:helix-turn-helix domain-containing protein [Candidatus Enterovibrio escacola]
MPTFAYLLFIIVRYYLTRPSIILDLRFSKATLNYKYDQIKLIALKYRFYPNNEQALMLVQTFGYV